MRWWSDPRPALLAAAFLFAAGPVSAARGTAGIGSAPAAADAGHGEGKDGLGFMQLERYDLGIFTLIVFGLLLLILQKTAFPKIAEGLKKREESIAGARDEAQKALKEAEDLRAKLKLDLAQAADQVRAMLEEARRDADALRQKEKDAGVKDAQAERERARREIDGAKDAALKEISERAIDLASLMSSKALQRQITPDDHRRLLDDSLTELAQQGKPSA